MLRIILMVALLFIAGCQTTPKIPTSPRLEAIKALRIPALADHLGKPTFIRIFKQEKTLELWLKEDEGYRTFKRYDICKYSGTLGPKLREGDLQAPEGFYEIQADQLNPWSKFHLSFNLGFPNAYDHAQGRTGSHLMIHGGCQSTGCYAVTDDSMEEIYLLVEAAIAKGHQVPVHIFPFRMTNENIKKHANSKWINFWQHLKHGYDQF